MQSVLDVVVPGLVVGCVYGLIGMAYAVIYQATRVVNFALGEVMMVIAYISFTIQNHLHLGFLELVPLTILVSAAVGLAIEYLVIRPMRGQPIFAIVMSTIGLAIVLRSATAIIWGALAVPITIDLSTNYYQVLGVQSLAAADHGRGAAGARLHRYDGVLSFYPHRPVDARYG